jgi:DNA-binding NtrC family response regulator
LRFEERRAPRFGKIARIVGQNAGRRPRRAAATEPCGLASGLLGSGIMTAPRILVVDDHLEMATMLADGLSDSGFVALAVGSGMQAIDALGREHFDAVVTDLRMADADGLEVLAASKRLDELRPVIVMTAYSAIDGAIESMRRGACHYLIKPFKTEALVSFLRNALAGELHEGE